MVADVNTIMSADQKEFVATHRQIMQCGAMAGQYVVEMARKLKVMRDGKLYRAAGFNEFRDYVKDAVGLEERQAYTYIKVAEELSDDFLSANAALGITKLALLASAEQEDREKAVEEGVAQNFFDENILFPSCRFCGRQQIAEQKFESGQEATEWATMHCECDEAKKYQQAKQKEEKRNKNREKIREAVEEVAQYCQSKLKVFEEELKNFLFVAGEEMFAELFAQSCLFDEKNEARRFQISVQDRVY